MTDLVLSPQTIEALRKAGEVLATQTEDVANQAIVYGRVMTLVEGAIYLAVWVAVIKGFALVKELDDDSYSDRDAKGFAFMVLCAVVFVLVCVAVAVANDVILPWVAPKVYLLKLLVRG